MTSIGEIVVVGCGVSPLDDMTVRTAEILTNVDQIVTIISAAKETWLPPSAWNVPIISLYHLYRPDRHRLDNYREAAETIISLAGDARRTALVTPGCPSVYDRMVMLVVERAHAAGLRIEIVPAVSSIEACLALLQEDMAPGVQIYEARWFHAKQVVPSVQIGCFLVQPGAFTTDQMATTSGLDPAGLQPLRDQLLQFYSMDHPVAFVRAPGEPADLGYLRVTELRLLCDGSELDLMGTTLYLPGLERADQFSVRWLRR
jgi:uncharacterized protein YabN with tetrapyrrole methylase and pyrophosphatase domain